MEKIWTIEEILETKQEYWVSMLQAQIILLLKKGEKYWQMSNFVFADKLWVSVSSIQNALSNLKKKWIIWILNNYSRNDRWIYLTEKENNAYVEKKKPVWHKITKEEIKQAKENLELWNINWYKITFWERIHEKLVNPKKAEIRELLESFEHKMSIKIELTLLFYALCFIVLFWIFYFLTK